MASAPFSAPVQTTAAPGGNLTFSGNPDYRGYLAALADNGNSQATALLNQFDVGNNGQVGQGTGVIAPALDQLNQQLYGQYEGLANPATGGSSSSSSSSSSQNNPNAVAYYTDLINQLGTQLQGAQNDEGLVSNNINTGYNNAVGEQGQNYTKATAENGQNRESGINGINSNSNQTFNSLEQLLGQNGAAVSSVARYNAPQAVAQQASTQRGGVDQTYNQNQSNLDESNSQALSDLLNQKNTNLSSALEGLKQQELQDQNAITSARINASQYGGESYATAKQNAASDQGSANNIQSQLDTIIGQYTTPTYTPPALPALNTFQTDPATVKAQQANPTTDSSFLPYLQNLNQPNLLTGSNTQPAATPAPAAGATS